MIKLYLSFIYSEYSVVTGFVVLGLGIMEEKKG